MVWEHSLRPHPHPWLPRGHPGRSWPISCPFPSQRCPGRSGAQGLDPGQGHYHLRDSIGQPVEGPGTKCLLGWPQPWLMGSSPHDLPGFCSLGLSLLVLQLLSGQDCLSLHCLSQPQSCPGCPADTLFLPSSGWVLSFPQPSLSRELGQGLRQGTPPPPQGCMWNFRAGKQGGTPPGILSVLSSAAPCKGGPENTLHPGWGWTWVFLCQALWTSAE